MGQRCGVNVKIMQRQLLVHPMVKPIEPDVRHEYIAHWILKGDPSLDYLEISYPKALQCNSVLH